LSRREAFLFITGSSLVFVLASGFISVTCFLCSFVVLGLLFGYSYTKRFTWLSHLVLGVVIGLAPVGVWVAVTDSLSGRIAMLSLVLATYIAGFDILYACQDVEFDRKEGLYSMPVRFGVQASMRFSAILHALTFLSLLSLYWIFSLSPVFMAFAVAIGILLVVEHRLVKPQDLTRIDIAFYHVNSIISVLIFLALVAEELMRRMF
jgi:4-hydroxybenzoate polyprenyltransferase